MRLTKRKDRVLVQIDTGTSIEGVLMGRSRGHYVLRASALKKDAEQTFALDGEVLIPAGRVEFFQRLTS